MSVYISPGNRKLGNIASVSIDPIYSCANDVSCRKDCYALRMVSFRKNIGKSWNRNYSIYKHDPGLYFEQIRSWIDKKQPPYFRFHVGGDIPDERYFSHVVRTTSVLPNTRFVMFTKRLEWAGNYIHEMQNVNNMRLLVSAWPNESPRLSFLFNAMLKEIRHMSDKIAVAWVDTDSRYKVLADNPFSCTNDCSSCHECWDGKTDILLHKH